MDRDFYFAYDLNRAEKTASRLYRIIDDVMERFDSNTNQWREAPEQYCIFAGEDIFYDEITKEEAKDLRILI